MRFKLDLNHDAEDLNEAFRIPEDRYDQIIRMVIEEAGRSPTISRVVENLANRCQNENELIIAVYLFGVFVGQNRTANMLAGLMARLLSNP